MPQALAPFAAAVFDMDGVLLDTEPLYKQAMHAACAACGFEMSDEVHAAQIGIPADTGDLMLHAHFGPDFPLMQYKAKATAIMRELTAGDIPVKPGALELLGALQSRGIPAAVATSTASPLAPERLKRAGLFDLFAAVVTRSDVANGKPHPEPFLTAAARLGVAPEQCIALEDSHNGIRAAHGAGMRAIMVPDLLQPTGEIRALCHAVMDSLHAVRAAAFGEAMAAG